MANAEDEIFLPGPKSTLLLEIFFQCPPHSNGRRLRSGDKNTVRDGSKLWSSAQYSPDALCRFRYYSCERFRDIDSCLKLVQSRHWPSRPKVQYLLQQVGWLVQVPLYQVDLRKLLQLDHTLQCSTNCKFFHRTLKEIYNQYDNRSGWGFAFSALPYGNVWRASRRMFTKYFNPSNPSINQPREIIYVRRFLGQLLLKPSDFLRHART